MDKDIKKKWVAALRSGRYIQAKSALRMSPRKFCVLGVLCDVVDKSKWEKDSCGNWRWGYHLASLPVDIADKAGIDFDTEIRLTDLNDGDKGKTFKQLATYISKNL